MRIFHGMFINQTKMNHKDEAMPGGREQIGLVSTFILVIIFAAFYSLTKTVSDLANEVDSFKKLLEEQANELKSYKSNQMVAFSARVKPSYNDIAPWATILFSDEETNIGNAYNAATGEFTAPRSGIYVFFGHVLTAGGKDIETALSINGNTKLWLYAGGANAFHGSGGNLLVVHLNTSDRVKMIKHGPWGTKPFYIHHIYSTFSGFLLRSDE